VIADKFPFIYFYFPSSSAVMRSYGRRSFDFIMGKAESFSQSVAHLPPAPTPFASPWHREDVLSAIASGKGIGGRDFY
jgi:hypothetical protein